MLTMLGISPIWAASPPASLLSILAAVVKSVEHAAASMIADLRAILKMEDEIVNGVKDECRRLYRVVFVAGEEQGNSLDRKLAVFILLPTIAKEMI